MNRICILVAIMTVTANANAGIVATVDFNAKTITFTGADTGAMTPEAGGGGWHRLEWHRDLLPPERVGTGSDADVLRVSFEGRHISTNTDLTIDFTLTAWDEVRQFSLEPFDFVTLGIRARTSFLSTEFVIWGSGAPLDISRWNAQTLENLQEAIDSGSLPLSSGSGWSPIAFQAAGSGAASVPEPGSLILLAAGSLAFAATRSRRRKNSQAVCS